LTVLWQRTRLGPCGTIPDLRRTVPIPTGPDEVGPEWVNAALSGDGQFKGLVTGLSVEVFDQATGFFSRLVRLRLSYEETGPGVPSSLVLKLAPTDPLLRSVGASYHFYEREVGFYRDLAPLGGALNPHCYWCDFDPETNDFGILLADVSSLASEDQLAGVSAGRLSTAAVGVADMHARWWGSAALEEYPWCRPLKAKGVDALFERYREVWPIFLDRFSNILPDGSERFGDAAADAMYGAVEQLSRGPATLAHGDFKADNLFFEGAPERVVTVDWQNTCRAVGPFDLAVLLAQSTSAEVRRAHQWDVLRSWHERVLTQVSTPYSYRDAVADYRRSVLFYLVHPVLPAPSTRRRTPGTGASRRP
jgi:hypothetical protein